MSKEKRLEVMEEGKVGPRVFDFIYLLQVPHHLELDHRMSRALDWRVQTFSIVIHHQFQQQPERRKQFVCRVSFFLFSVGHQATA